MFNKAAGLKNQKAAPGLAWSGFFSLEAQTKT
jgi:hypothetical protein